MASKDIKTKSKDIERKSAPKEKSAPKGSTDAALPVKEVIRDQFIKEKAAEGQQEQQPERGENYAVEKVEDPASTAADTVYRTGKSAISHAAENRPKTKEAANAEKTADVQATKPAPNTPKTRDGYIRSQGNIPSEASDMNTPKTKEQTPVKGQVGATVWTNVNKVDKKMRKN